MQSFCLPENEHCIALLFVAALGTVAIVGLAALAARTVRSAAWQRVVWQTATLGVLALFVIESTGAATAMVRLWRAGAAATMAPDRAVVSTDERRPSAEVESPAAAAIPEWPALPAAAERFAETALIEAPAIDLAGPDDLAARSDAALVWLAAEADEVEYTINEADAIASVPPARLATMADDEPSSADRDALQQAPADVPTAHGANVATAQILAEDPRPSPIGWWLGVLWALGAAAVVGRTLWARAMLCLFRRRSVPIGDCPLVCRAGRLARRLRIRRRVALVESAGLKAPVAFGVLRPVVALPVGFADDFDRRQQNAVLAHELAHLAAGDPAWHLAADLVCAALWWHPLAWWQRGQLRAASEAAADEASLLVPDGPDVLASCLVALGRRLACPEASGQLSVGGPGFRTNLGRRVERLLSLPARSWQAPGRGRLFLARSAMPVVLAVVAITCTAWARPPATGNEGGTTMNVLTASWRNSLAGAVLAWAATSGAHAMAGDQPREERLPDPAVAARAEGDRDAESPEAAESRRGDRDAGPAEQRRREGGEARQEALVQARAGQIEDLAAAMSQLEERLAAAMGRLDLQAADGAVAIERFPAAQRLLDFEQQRRELLERAAALQSEIQALGPTDRVGQLQARLGEARTTADRIKKRLDSLAQRLAAAGGPPRPFAVPADPERQRRVEALTAAIGRLREAGLEDEARALERRLPEIAGQPEPRPAVPDELRNRIRQVEVAIENLRAAGMPDQAERLVQQVERLRAEEDRRVETGVPAPAGYGAAAAGYGSAAGRVETGVRTGYGSVGGPVVGTMPVPVPREPREPRPPQEQPEFTERLQQQQVAIRQLNAEVTQLRQELGQLRELIQQSLQRERVAPR